MEIRTDNGILYTKKLPANYEPACCNDCGCRIGWSDTDLADLFVGYCDDCTARISQGDDV